MNDQNKDEKEFIQEGFYQDEGLIERAGGNRELLDRLVGLSIAEAMLEESPEDPSLKRTYDIMKSEVERLENQ